MISRTNDRFWREFDSLPGNVKEHGKSAFWLFRKDPYHNSLHFQRVHQALPIYSARVGMHYRAVCVRNGDELMWFWIGSHADYDQLLRQI